MLDLATLDASQIKMDGAIQPTKLCEKDRGTTCQVVAIHPVLFLSQLGLDPSKLCSCRGYDTEMPRPASSRGICSVSSMSAHFAWITELQKSRRGFRLPSKRRLANLCHSRAFVHRVQDFLRLICRPTTRRACRRSASTTDGLTRSARTFERMRVLRQPTAKRRSSLVD
jgi:hypothetical protein